MHPPIEPIDCYCGRGPSCSYCGHRWNSKGSGGRSRNFRGLETAFDGIFASWVTDEVLVMSRPSSRTINEYELPSKFLEAGIRLVVCCQEPGEHATCGDGVLPSGLAYRPDEFTSKGIDHLHKYWEDLEVPSFEQMTVIVRKMHETTSRGYKVSVHCHAGLGRAPLSALCFLAHRHPTESPESLLSLVRRRRGPVLNGEQEDFYFQFVQWWRSQDVESLLSDKDGEKDTGLGNDA
ncbi:phosphatases II [Gonapodya prolifera JEL478]|uniref:Phosphatases II n=1 Tax=Gonapodya prolifera (strain JEL478) TaxID=1344416 RepID=A0A139A2T9_GONPJ|nr:phosphatases II [Gonapodya prolifera JEL478]|eukprot:KXS10968.1 phosphatases II [Gonapodya prolifera JEL478]